MNTSTHPLSPALSTHLEALRQADAGSAAQADAAQRRLDDVLAARSAAGRARARPRRRTFGWAVAATCAAVLALALAPVLVGNRGGAAFAAALQRLRDFTTLSMTIETTVAGHALPPVRIRTDRAGDTRTESGNLTTVIVNRKREQVLILLQPAHRAIRYPIPAGGAAATGKDLAWLDAVRTFRGQAKALPGKRRMDGVAVRGWAMDAQGLHLVLWVDADGVPHAMDINGAASMHQHLKLQVDAPLDPRLFSTDLPTGYALVGPDRAGDN